MKNTTKKKNYIAVWIVSIVCLVLIAAGLLLWRYLRQPEPFDPPQNIETQEPGAWDLSVDLGNGMQLVSVGPYTGAYVEDGSNEVVADVLMIIVSNTGTQAIEYAQITMPVGEETASFSVSTLLPGSAVVLLEKSRMTYSGAEDYEQAAADTVAMFRHTPSLHADQLQLQVLEGVINVTNISGGDITGDILIYYKNRSEDLYYGGITYRVRVEGGLEDGQIKQIQADHFSASGSEVVFVTIG